MDYLQQVNMVEDYLKSLNNFDLDQYLLLFTPDCVVNDPYGSAEFRGENGQRKFFTGMTETWHFFEMRTDSVYPGGNDRLAVRWSVSGTAKNAKTAEFSGISVFQFAGDKISRLDAYWHLGNMLAQIRE
ncbi:MAG: nuclear transport factor 2 family protein [Anaerolineae bacterium]|nr:MAG: nuclear transport factor 2 family protein [Anaerolineae bacterium]